MKKLKKKEVILIACLSISVCIPLSLSHLLNKRNDMLSPHSTTLSLVDALKNNKQDDIERLTTDNGFNAIEQYKKHHGSYQRITFLLLQMDKSISLPKDFDGVLFQKWGVSSSKAVKADYYKISFRRGIHGWELDELILPQRIPSWW